MSHRTQVRDFIEKTTPLTVGSVADLEQLTEAPQNCDLVELRLDSLGYGADVLAFAERSPLPLLITARGAAEGGQADWSIQSRAAAYRALMPYASLIDIELQDFPHLSDIIDDARTSEIIVIGSFHDFDATPALKILQEKTQQEKADIYKFALMARSIDDIETHISLIKQIDSENISIMGMGPLGAAARPLMAKAGSLLNYGYLGGTPTAPNQWPAPLLSAALSV